MYKDLPFPITTIAVIGNHGYVNAYEGALFVALFLTCEIVQISDRQNQSVNNAFLCI